MWKSDESKEDIFEKTREMYNKLNNIVEDSSTRSKRKSSIVGIAHRVLVETFHRALDRALKDVPQDDESGVSVNYNVKINNPKRSLKTEDVALKTKDSRPKKPKYFDPEVHVVKVVKNQDFGSESASLSSDKSNPTKNAILEAIRAGIVSPDEVKQALGLSGEVGRAKSLFYGCIT
jgi:hypothetical protein